MTLSWDETMMALGGRLGCSNPAMHGLLYTQPGYEGLAGKSSRGALAMVQQQFAEAEAAYNAALPQAERGVSRLKDLASRLGTLAVQVETATEGRTSVADYADQVTSAAERAIGAARPLEAAFREAQSRWKARYDEAKAGSQNVLTSADAKPMQEVAAQATALAAELEGADADGRRILRQIQTAVSTEKRREEETARVAREEQASYAAEQQRIAAEAQAAREEAQRIRDLESQREAQRFAAEQAERQARLEAERAEREAIRQERTGTTQAEYEWRRYEADQGRAREDAMLQLELQRLEREEQAREREEARQADRDQLDTLIKLVGAGLLPKESIAQAFGVQAAPQQVGPPMFVSQGATSPYYYPPQNMPVPPAVVAPQAPGFEFDSAFTPGGQMFGMNGLLYTQPGYEGLARGGVDGLLYTQPGYEGLARGVGELELATSRPNAALPPGARVETGYRIYMSADTPGDFTVIQTAGNKTRKFPMTYRQATQPGARVRDPGTGQVFYTTPESPDDGGPGASTSFSAFTDALSKIADKGVEVYGKVTGRYQPEQPRDEGPGLGTILLGGAAAVGLGWGAVKLVQRLRQPKA